jgi:hypothetical protein
MRRAFRDRRDRYLVRCETLRDNARMLLDILGKTRHASLLARIRIEHIAPAPIITDATQLADRYVDIEVVTTRTPNKKRIAQALADGEVVDGAALSNATTRPVVTRTARPVQGGDDDDDDPR